MMPRFMNPTAEEFAHAQTVLDVIDGPYPLIMQVNSRYYEQEAAGAPVHEFYGIKDPEERRKIQGAVQALSDFCSGKLECEIA